MKEGIPRVEKAQLVVRDFNQREETDVAYMKNVIYSSAVESLMYTMICTRPDLAYVLEIQSIVALSTTEAEYITATEGVKEATWLRGLVMELSDTYPAKTKHIDVRYHFIRDVI
nr:Retrovirus-related Pol polyprotein from transposon TNT 1-94 [Ipomoea batatas]